MPRFFGKLFFSGRSFGTFGACGWSEVYGIDAANYSAAQGVLSPILTARLNLLAVDASFTYGVISDTDIKGDSYWSGITPPHLGTYVGVATTYNPEVALRTKFYAGASKRSARFIRCVPFDEAGPNGEYAPAGPWAANLATYLNLVQTTTEMFHRIAGAVAPPFYSDTPYTGYAIVNNERRAIGRPFGSPRGRRLVA